MLEADESAAGQTPAVSALQRGDLQVAAALLRAGARTVPSSPISGDYFSLLPVAADALHASVGSGADAEAQFDLYLNVLHPVVCLLVVCVFAIIFVSLSLFSCMSLLTFSVSALHSSRTPP